MKYIRQGESLKDTIDFLLNEVENIGLKIKGLYLDREFFTVEVINYLQKRQTPFIIPCILRGRSGGIRNLFTERKSYTTRYTMRSRKGKATFTTHIVVKYSKSKYKRKGIRYFAYAIYGMDIPVNKTFKEYRKRFGIESSLQINEPGQSKNHHQKTRPKTLIHRIGLLTGEHLDLHPMDLS